MQRILKLLAPVAVAVMAAIAQAAPADLALHDGSRLWLTGTSTVHDYTSKATRLEVALRSDPGLWPANLEGAEAVRALIAAKGVTGMDVEIPVTGLKSGKDGLDKNMYKALLADQHPAIRFRMAGYEVGAASDTATAIEVRGTLQVAGVDREITMSATARPDGGAIRFRCAVPLLMTQFGIKPPKMMLGAIKTSDKVTVHLDLLIGPAGAAAATAGTE